MKEFDWGNTTDNREEKIKLAQRMAKRVKDGEIIGVGSGSTSYLALEEIGKRIKQERLNIQAIPTSNIIKEKCIELGIKVLENSDIKPDWCFDGADEIDTHNWMIKGLGAALYKEKINIKNSDENYILVDKTKFVDYLGQKKPIPVECDIDKIENVTTELEKLGAIKVEKVKSNVGDGLLITDNGKALLHVNFEKITADLEEKINQIDGVLENGLFIGYDIIIIS